MTEEDFIKEYFSSKNIINESVENELSKSMVAFLGDFISSTNPVAKMLLTYLGYEIARGSANSISGIKKFGGDSDKINNKKLESVDKNFKGKSTKDILKKLKITNTIKNKSNKYLKYFLIMFSVMNYLSKKQIMIHNSDIENIYDNLHSNTYTMTIDNEVIAFNNTWKTIINGATILDERNDKIKDFKDAFKKMMTEFFITDKKLLLHKTLVLITFEEIKSKSLNEANIEVIFKKFYQHFGRQISYKIGND